MMKIIDAHSHLWLRQDTMVNGQPILTLENGRSLFMGEVRQMLPPFLIDGRNTAEASSPIWTTLRSLPQSWFRSS